MTFEEEYAHTESERLKADVGKMFQGLLKGRGKKMSDEVEDDGEGMILLPNSPGMNPGRARKPRVEDAVGEELPPPTCCRRLLRGG